MGANTSALEAKPKTGMSYTWRSILRGLQVIKQGMIWRVGDGYNLNIWKDPWLPKGVTRRPITPRGACLVTQVAELINPATGLQEDGMLSWLKEHFGRKTRILYWHCRSTKGEKISLLGISIIMENSV